MAVRAFESPDGITWTVWEVIPGQVSEFRSTFGSHLPGRWRTAGSASTAGRRSGADASAGLGQTATTPSCGSGAAPPARPRAHAPAFGVAPEGCDSAPAIETGAVEARAPACSALRSRPGRSCCLPSDGGGMARRGGGARGGCRRGGQGARRALRRARSGGALVPLSRPAPRPARGPAGRSGPLLARGRGGGRGGPARRRLRGVRGRARLRSRLRHASPRPAPPPRLVRALRIARGRASRLRCRRPASAELGAWRIDVDEAEYLAPRGAHPRADRGRRHATRSTSPRACARPFARRPGGAVRAAVPGRSAPASARYLDLGRG